MRKITLSFLLLAMVGTVFSQGLSIAPTRLYFANDLGESDTKVVTVKNKSNKEQSYQVNFGDFQVNNTKGKPTLQEAGENPHSITPWVSATPNFFTMKPGEVMDIHVTLDIPNTPEGYSVKWGTMGVRLASEQVDPIMEGAQDRMGMGIVNVFQLSIYLFQTPPSITERDVEIYDFRRMLMEKENKLMLASKNISPSIIDCYSYLEFMNLNTGYSKTTEKKRFTLLPEAAKEMTFEIPKDLPKGKYSVMGVVDYGSNDEIKAAELELTVE